MLFSKLKLNYFSKILLSVTLLTLSHPTLAIEESKVTNNKAFVVFSLNKSLAPLSKSKIRMLYKGKVKRLNKSNVQLLDLSDDSPYKASFYKLLLGKSLSQLNGYRASLAFSGKGNIPESLDNDDLDGILLWLDKNPNGIAYTPKMSLPEHVNVLFELEQGK